MKHVLLSLCLMTTMGTSAHTFEVVETVCADTIDLTNPPTPQIPLTECDSMTVSSVADRYAVVWKDGKCGVYDLAKHENVTRIEYSHLHYAYRKEFESEWYTYFAWEEIGTLGVVGISEATNQYIAIAAPKEKEDNWGDSIPTYIQQARQCNAAAYMKLAVCYHEGKGVEHNFPMLMAMLKGVETFGDGKVMERFFASLDKDDPDRRTFEGLMELEKSGIDDYDVVMAVAQRGGELTEKMIRAAWLQREGKDTEYVALLEELAGRIPSCYAKLGEYYKDRDRQKALEYYRRADEWACLTSAGAELLLEDLYRQERQGMQLNKYEVKRLRLIKDGIGG